MDGPSPVMFSKNKYPIPIDDTETVCADVDVTDNGTSTQSLPDDESEWLGLRRLMPEICARVRALVNGESPLPPETEAPATDTVTGASNPSESGAMLMKPEFTVAESGVSTVRVTGFEPSSDKEALLDTDSPISIQDSQPRFPYA